MSHLQLVKTFLRRPAPKWVPPPPVTNNHIDFAVESPLSIRLQPQFADAEQFLANISSTAPSADPNFLPQNRVDIRGIHSAGYLHVYSRKLFRQMPTLVGNKFFSLKFFPSTHHLSYVRKSNIAYAFSHTGGLEFNNARLASHFKLYRGPFQSHPFFRVKALPLRSACQRTKYRKRIRTAMVEAFAALKPDVNKVAGVYFFRLAQPPATNEDLAFVKERVLQAVKEIQDDEFQAKVNLIAKSHLTHWPVLEKTVRSQMGFAVQGAHAKYPFLPKSRRK